MPEDNKFFTLEHLCRILSISIATGRNWIKEGKIAPQQVDGKELLFSHQYLRDLKKSIMYSSGNTLKSRRNKKCVSGSKFYLNYISEFSPNRKAISQVAKGNSGASNIAIRAILADCARQLVTEVFGTEKESAFNELIRDISEKRVNIGKCTFISGEDTLGLLYLSLLGLRRRKVSGIYYTPTSIIREANCELFKTGLSGKVMDPCCGTGNFLLQLPDASDPALIYGSDIDPLAVAVARINFALKFKIDNANFIKEHIFKQNLLHISNEEKYDFIIGNPPWGSDFSAKDSYWIRKNFQSVGRSIESGCCMTEKALSLLAPDGKLAFILPESLLHTQKHSAFRQFLSENCSIDFVKYIGDVFGGVQCPGVIIGLSKRVQQKTIHITRNNDHYVVEADFALVSEGFTFCQKPEERKIIEKMADSSNTVTLKGRATFALGIVTGNNKNSLSDTPLTLKHEPVICGTDIGKYKIGKAKKFLFFEPERFQQTAPEHIYRTSPKLFYRFISKELNFACDWNGVLSLNSCNIVIPHTDDLDIRYIMAVFNSRPAQFFFDTFNSVKVLRRHLETIPIPLADKNAQEEIIFLVDKITNSTGSTTALYDEADKKIAALYDLSDAEYQTIVAATGK